MAELEVRAHAIARWLERVDPDPELTAQEIEAELRWFVRAGHCHANQPYYAGRRRGGSHRFYSNSKWPGVRVVVTGNAIVSILMYDQPSPPEEAR